MGLFLAVLTFIVTLFIGVPVGVSLGLMGLVGVAFMGTVPLEVVAQRIFTGLDSFPLMCIPFFILAGDLMNSGKITERLIKFADMLVGRMRGALAHANIIASMFFGGITGSAAADVSALGSMLIPAMEEDGYSPDFSAAVTASSSLQGPIIPPSILAVIYGATMGQSIGALFAAGIPLGILFGLSDMAVVIYLAKKKNFPKKILRLTTKERLSIVGQAIVALVMPLIILGGILSGVFTPTEAAGVAVGYAFFISLYVLKTVKYRDLPKIILNAAYSTGTVFLLLAAANLFSWVLSTYQVPRMITNGILSISENPVIIILLIDLILLLVGTVMDPGAAIIMLAPALAPLAMQAGLHPIQFGMLMITTLALGLITPPVGLCLFISADIAKISMERVAKAVFPFFIIHLLVIGLISFSPDIVLFSPKIFGYL
ncbi:TRAP transporter large permease [Marispirochaeta sp.]|jgi:tripartite ATP-independent transporter DctM subunit|uniref:TRAP transporter large permease n=1 Tax=Marispirochaeta sp. TaxID=2038653 RepID=UPI0029C89B2B|nr:TRAP transporter large permease [Marispirochaeta sp.]